MKRKCITAAAAAMAAMGLNASNADSRPNIVLFMVDDMVGRTPPFHSTASALRSTTATALPIWNAWPKWG